MRALARWAAAAVLILGAWPGAADEAPRILSVDRERALSESAAAERLGVEEREARIALRGELDKLRADLEAEEAEIAALRETAPKEVFEARVRAFDARVREARETSQQKGEALQARFVSARRALSAALEPILRELLAETGADLILDARTVLAAAESVDVTDEVLRRFDERASVALPPPAPAEE
ncbi:OmpH family outer membrane protein [Pikeienuella sp. HZG-20]|uniref:OmpH family outer membrane protein n=1 Tax=Paludibacillus litoralis TaxID=3133267 RepID=UPI0030EB2E71